jgi:spore coat protein A
MVNTMKAVSTYMQLSLLCVVAIGANMSAASDDRSILDARQQPKFVNDLPNPLDRGFIFKSEKDRHGCKGSFYSLGLEQFKAELGIIDPESQQQLKTTMWGFASDDQCPTYPSRTFLAESHKANHVLWKNNLRRHGKNLPHLLPVDTTLHWADPKHFPASGVPIVTHLHGGLGDYLSDGHPDAWFTPNSEQRGPQVARDIYDYENDQEAATLWYHDHALGLTRLNVYAGSAGFYILRDKNEKDLIANHNLPDQAFELPVVIQDKMFLSDGSLYYPTGDNPQNSILPEFFGNFIIVNGKAWPKCDVEPRFYRLRLLNGSDSRFYHLTLKAEGAQDRLPFYQIGTDQGFLNAPVSINELLIAPGERADILIDFAGHDGESFIVYNDAPTPFPNGDPVEVGATDLIMKINVSKPLSPVADMTLPATLRKEPIPHLLADKVRRLLLWETEDEYGRVTPVLGTAKEGMLMWDDEVTEKPRTCSTEVWELYNTTEDAHPIHLHGVKFQIVNRQFFSADQDEETGALSGIDLMGAAIKPAANEAGWKDTVVALPGEEVEGQRERVYGMLTRIIVRFDLPGDYVWHCHILSHEDHDMMRPLVVSPAPSCKRTCPIECVKKRVSREDKAEAAEFNALYDRASDEPVASPSKIKLWHIVGIGAVTIGAAGALWYWLNK